MVPAGRYRAEAYIDPHVSTYSVDTADCAMCHRAHAGQGNRLLFYTDESVLCFTCHDGTGASGTPSVKTQMYRAYAHSLQGVSSAYTMGCSSCHESHRTATSGAHLVDPRATTQGWSIVQDVSGSYYSSGGPRSGVYIWCETCHVASTRSGTLLTATSNPYVPNEVAVEWKTSRSPTASPNGVPENGRTTDFWEYFTAVQYNTAGSGGEWHGAGNTASLVVTLPYTSPYPAMPCTDCHDNHGSNQPWMIVGSVSTAASIVTGYDMTATGSFGQLRFCQACHDRVNCTVSENDFRCTDCHRHGNLF